MELCDVKVGDYMRALARNTVDWCLKYGDAIWHFEYPSRDKHDKCMVFICVANFYEHNGTQLWIYDQDNGREHAGSMWMVHGGESVSGPFVHEVVMYDGDIVVQNPKRWASIFDPNISMDHLLEVESLNAENLIEFGKKIMLYQIVRDDSVTQCVAFASKSDMMEYVLKYGPRATGRF